MAQQYRGDFVGNGEGVITQQDVDDLQKALSVSQSNFGSPNRVLFAPLNFQSIYLEINPQYAGTEWAYISRLSRREHAFAKLQSFLLKFNLQKHLEDEDARHSDWRFAIKRLKQAKWARYKKNKVQSSP